MSGLVDVDSWQVQTSQGVLPATVSMIQGGVEVPLEQAQVVVPDAPVPPAPLWAKPAIGLIGTSEAAFTAMNAGMGPVVVRRTYDGTLPASWAASAAASDVAAGRHSYWSYKPSPVTFPGDTAAQTAFSNFLDTIPEHHQATIVVWHEPEDNIQAGDYTVAQWGALQNTVGAIVRSKNRSNLRMGVCWMGPWTFDTRSPYFNFDWDGSLDWSLIDVIGIDPYRTQQGSTMTLETLLTVRNSGSGSGSAPSVMERLLTYSKPISLMEWGAFNSTEASVATFIDDAYAWMCRWNQTHLTPASGHIESAIWYNMTLEGLDTSLTGVEVDAYRGIIADSKIPPS